MSCQVQPAGCLTVSPNHTALTEAWPEPSVRTTYSRKALCGPGMMVAVPVSPGHPRGQAQRSGEQGCGSSRHEGQCQALWLWSWT